MEPNGIRWKSAMNTDDDDVILTKTLPANALTGAQWSVFGRSGHLRVQTSGKESELRFDGFPQNDFDKLSQALSNFYKVDLVKHSMSSSGASFGLTGLQKRHLVMKQCILDDAYEEGEEFEPKDGDEMFSINLAEVSQCVVQGNTSNEVELQFHELDTVETGTDQLGKYFLCALLEMLLRFCCTLHSRQNTSFLSYSSGNKILYTARS